MAVTLYHYPGCSTCRRARKHLAAKGVEPKLVDLVETPPAKSRLRKLWKASGQPLKKLFNTSGQSYRNGGFKDRLPDMTVEDQLEAHAADGKLIKRPLAVAGGTTLVGFREDDWVAALEQGVKPWTQPWNATHAAGPVSRPLRHNCQPYCSIILPPIIISELFPPHPLALLLQNCALPYFFAQSKY